MALRYHLDRNYLGNGNPITWPGAGANSEIYGNTANADAGANSVVIGAQAVGTASCVIVGGPQGVLATLSGIDDCVVVGNGCQSSQQTAGDLNNLVIGSVTGVGDPSTAHGKNCVMVNAKSTALNAAIGFNAVNNTSNSCIIGTQNANQGIDDFVVKSSTLNPIEAQANPGSNLVGLLIVAHTAGGTTVKQVQFGAADSGGVGFRALAITVP